MSKDKEICNFIDVVLLYFLVFILLIVGYHRKHLGQPLGDRMANFLWAKKEKKKGLSVHQQCRVPWLDCVRTFSISQVDHHSFDFQVSVEHT